MHNYNMLNSQIQSVGILKANSCHLTKIARKLNEDIKLKKTVERLFNNFMSFDYQETLKANYINYLKELNLIGDNPIFIVDDSDISKPLSKHLEGLDYVLDGSNEHKQTLGYWLTEIVTLSTNKTPLILIFGPLKKRDS